jgi:hypothetical protein
VEVVGHGTTTYTLDYAAGDRILAEEAGGSATLYLYGRDCLGEQRGGEWLYYLPDAEGYVRQGTDAQGNVASTWLFDPDGTLLEGPEGPVSHLVCGGVYDSSTGLIYRDGRYFDPLLGIWLALMPLIVVQSWKRRKKGRGWSWYSLLLLGICLTGVLTGCDNPPTSEQLEQLCVEMPTPGPRAECTAMPTTGAEPPYEPERWNDCGVIQFSNNCYSYAVNDPLGHEYNCKPQPGVAGGRPWDAGASTLEEALTYDSIANAAIADGLVPVGCDASCASGWYKVALVIDPYEGSGDVGDYHWYRQDQGGCWSSKSGHSSVTNLDADMPPKVISDPRTADRHYLQWHLNYSEFGGCFCVPQSGIQTRCP